MDRLWQNNNHPIRPHRCSPTISPQNSKNKSNSHKKWVHIVQSNHIAIRILRLRQSTNFIEIDECRNMYFWMYLPRPHVFIRLANQFLLFANSFRFFFADEGELNCGPDSVDQLPSCLNYNARNLWDIFQPQIRIDTHTRYDGWCVSTNQNGNPIKRYPFRYRAKKVYCTGVLYAIPIFRASANGSYRACPMRWDYGPFSTPNTYIEWI